MAERFKPIVSNLGTEGVDATAGPSFAGSSAAGGADADLLIGHLLVDVKATTKHNLPKRDVQQLVTYALLDFEDRYRIESVAILLARFGVIVDWDLDELLATVAGERVSASELRTELAGVLRGFLIARTHEARRSGLNPLYHRSAVVPPQSSNTGKTPEFDTLDGMTEVDVAPSELSDWLVGRGRHFISTAEVAKIYGINPTSVPASLERPREAGKLISVTKGGWVPVPAEYRIAGAPPPSHFIDQLMEYLGYPYYVGFLSAAAIYGASHQSPMVFQVATPAKLRERRVGRARLQFIQRSAAEQRPRKRNDVPTGRIWVATPEVTVFDLVEAPHDGGGLSNVATVIGEFLGDERLDPAALRSVAGIYPVVVAQRVGYLVDVMAGEVGVEFDSGPLHDCLMGHRYRELSPGAGDGLRDERWHVIINTDIEHDL